MLCPKPSLKPLQLHPGLLLGLGLGLCCCLLLRFEGPSPSLRLRSLRAQLLAQQDLLLLNQLLCGKHLGCVGIGLGGQALLQVGRCRRLEAAQRLLVHHLCCC